MPDTTSHAEPLAVLTTEICCAFVSNNPVPPAELPKLIGAVHTALAAALGLGVLAQEVFSEPEIQKPSPADIRRSVTPDALISFIDGRPYKTMKRHLGTHGLTPQSYRARYGLPSDYPMVAPNYAAQRSALAKSIGLGRPGGTAPGAASGVH